MADISTLADSTAVEIDSEISSMQSQIETLREQLRLQSATILSSRTSQSILARLRSQGTSQSKSPMPSTLPSDADPLSSIASQQQAHNRENLYRACASITTFRIRDPDPNAVDDGKVLGIRFDVSNGGKFIRPYYIMLNKPFLDSQALRIHRHTLPPCIPLASLSGRYLPRPNDQRESGLEKPGKKQDLLRFGRVVRREIIGYHNRLSTIKSLRREFALDEEVSRKGKAREKVIVDISAADPSANQIRMEWADGRIGRCVVGDKGEVQKCVVIGEGGRDWEVEHRILKEGARMENIGERLREGIY